MEHVNPKDDFLFISDQLSEKEGRQSEGGVEIDNDNFCLVFLVAQSKVTRFAT